MRALLLTLTLISPATAQDTLVDFDRFLTLAPGVFDGREEFETRIAETFPELTPMPFFDSVGESDGWIAGSRAEVDGKMIGLYCQRYGLQSLNIMRAPCETCIERNAPRQAGVPEDAVAMLKCTIGWEGPGLPSLDPDAIRTHLGHDFMDLENSKPWDFRGEVIDGLSIEAHNGPRVGSVWTKEAAINIFDMNGNDLLTSYAKLSFTFKAFAFGGES